MALLTNHQALVVYNSLFGLFYIEPQWVSQNSVFISNGGHVIGFCVLAIFCRLSTQLRFWQIALLCFILAASLELTQKLLTYRQGRWDDLMLGVMGTSGGLWVISVWETTIRGKTLERGARDGEREEA